MRLAIGGIAAALLVLLSGCAAAAPAATQTPVAEPTSTSTATAPSAPLTCDELVQAELVTAAMTGVDGVAPEPASAVRASAAFASLELAAAGGLGCSWRVGEAPDGIFDGSGDISYLTVEVLPGAAAEWQPLWYDDVPSDQTLDVDGILASRTFGEWGWELSAPVGDAWVEIRLAAPGLGTIGTRYDGIPPEEIYSRLGAVAASTFDVVGNATVEQLAWPPAETKREGQASCRGGLDPQGIEAVLGVPLTDVSVADPTAGAPVSFSQASSAAAGSYSCFYLTGTPRTALVTVVHGAGELFNALNVADVSTAFESLDVSAAPGYTQGDVAIRAVVTDGPGSPVIMRIGDAVYEIQSSERAVEVAEAILAQVR